MANKKIWSRKEILEMWPQAKGELQGFQRHLEARSSITASQLGMALHLAEEEYKRLLADPYASTRLTELSFDGMIASKHKFRAIVVIDSAPYQIEDEVDTYEDAYKLVRAFARPDNLKHIFDDIGCRLTGRI